VVRPDKHHLDLRGTLCPLNFVKTKLRLEELDSGEQLEVLLDEGEPIQNVPRSIRDEGHKILELKREGDFFKVVIEKAEDR
jgi:tRNA 2-thiouridine synthesizing protein A